MTRSLAGAEPRVRGSKPADSQPAPLDAPRVPYPGLRSFRREEAGIFFGRDEEVDQLLQRLSDNRFLGVLGASGSGKSSLVRTGLFEALEGGFGPVGAQWRFADCLPGGAPIAKLAEALLKADQADPPETDVEALEARLRRGPRSIVEWCEESHIKPGWKLLILVDQFEELFNYASLEAREDAQAYVALLTESAKSERAPIYVMITMRSDYFGACGAYPDLAEAISRSIFLTPRMLRDACREAIAGPAAVMGFEIGEALQSRLLNDMGRFAPLAGARTSEPIQAVRESDQLPLMQYALNRMWKRATGSESGDRGDPTPIELTLDDYQGIGGLTGALNTHGEEVIRGLGLADEKPVEAVFRALVRGPSVALAIRDPHTVADIVAISGLDLGVVTRVVDAFAGEDCQFLRATGPLGPDSYIDITHESLIRQWTEKLSVWLMREAQAADIWRNLASQAADWEREGRPDALLLPDLPLARRREWWTSQGPTPAWADRYSPAGLDGEALVGFEVVQAFLDRGEARRLEFEAEFREMEREAEKTAARRRRLTRYSSTATIAALIVGIAGTAAYAVQQTKYARQQARDKFEQHRLLRIASQARDTAKAAVESETLAAAKQTALAMANRDLLDRQIKLTDAANASRRDAVQALDQSRRSNGSLIALIHSEASRLEDQHDRVGTVAAATLANAEQLSKLLESSPGAHTAGADEQLAHLHLLAAETAAEDVGADASGQAAAKTIAAEAEAVRKHSNDPALVARSYAAQGEAAELRQDYAAAAKAYVQSYQAVASERAPAAAAAGQEASAALIRLHRRIGLRPEIDQIAGRCAELSGPSDERRLATIGCRAAAAELRLDQGRKEDAGHILLVLEDDAALASPTTDAAGDDTPPETSLPRLKLHIFVEALRARQFGVFMDVDDALVEQAKQQLLANPNAEQPASVYASALEANEAFDTAYSVRLPLLMSDNTSTNFLMDSLPLLWRFETEGGEDEIPPTGESALDQTLAAIDKAGALVRVLTVLAARGAPDPHLAAQLPGVAEMPPRTQMAQLAATGLDERLKRMNAGLMRLANEDGLLEDLRSSPSTHVNWQDSVRVASVTKLVGEYRTLCTPGPDRIHPECGTAFDTAVTALDPIVRSQGGREKQSRDRPVVPTPVRAFWLEGYDVTTYASGPRLVRGDENVKLQPVAGGPTMLFANEAARDRFRAAPRQYLPAYGGSAVEWVALGDRTPGQPKLSCVFGGRRFLFALRTTRDDWCRVDAKPADVARLAAAADTAWVKLGAEATSLADPSVKLREPVVGGDSHDLGSTRMYLLRPGSRVVAPASGIVEARAGSTNYAIHHADGSISRFSIMHGALVLRNGALVVAGAPITVTNPDGQTPQLNWRYLRPMSDGVTRQVSVTEFVGEAQR
ncbi:MAG: hypothetical protein E7812_12540 [Phenylobacterium sp.]|nr:MAG: hypothetical protein E7812_12540 [Phenylobacterium sp.]